MSGSGSGQGGGGESRDRGSELAGALASGGVALAERTGPERQGEPLPEAGAALSQVAVLLAGARSDELLGVWRRVAETLGRALAVDRVSIAGSNPTSGIEVLASWREGGGRDAPPPWNVLDPETRDACLGHFLSGEPVTLGAGDEWNAPGDAWLAARGARELLAVPLFVESSFTGAVVLEWLTGTDREPSFPWRPVVREVGPALAASLRRFAGPRDGDDVRHGGVRLGNQLLASLDHALRTPLQGVLGTTELFEDASLTDEQREALAIVRGSGRALLGVIDSALDLSRISLGTLDLDELPFSLRDLVYRTIKSVAAERSDARFELECQISPEVPDALRGDRARVSHALRSMLRLSLGIPGLEGAVVRVSCESGEADQAHVHFAIIDSGASLPTSGFSRLFESQGVEAIIGEIGDGATALDLALSKLLVEKMGGRIWTERDPTSGCVFHFTLIFGLEPESRGARGSTLPPAVRELPVLIGVGSPAMQDELAAMLLSWQLRPALLPGPEAFSTTLQRGAERGERYSLAICEVPSSLPGSEDVEKRIEAEALAHGVPLVLLTQGARDAVTGSSWHSEHVPRLSRPVTPGELFDALLLSVTRSQDASRSAGDVAAGSVPPRPLRVLLAEDHPVNRALAVKLLEREGHSVTAVADGKSAVRALDDTSFDIVLMDLQMPVMGGVDATAAIRAKERGSRRHVPIVAVTAHSQREDRQLCLAVGMDAYLSKPLEASELFATMQRLAALGEGIATRGAERGT